MKLILSVFLLVAAFYLWQGNIPTIQITRLPTIRFPKLISRRETIDFEEQIGFLYSLKAQVLSGATNRKALEVSLATMSPTQLIETRMALLDGKDIDKAMRIDSEKYSFQALADFALIFQVSDESGAPVGNALTRLIKNMVANRASKQLIAAELASTKATIAVLASLPLIGFCLSSLLGATPTSWLLGSTIGRFFLVTGVVLEVLGVLWVKHLASKATSPVGQFVKDKDKVAWQSLATTLENLSLCLAAGLNIGDALSKVSANAPPDVFEDLSVVVSKYELGAPMNITLQELGNAKARWRPITDALVGALVSGGPVQNHLEDLLNSLRITAEMENLKRIRGLSVRAVAPLGLCFLPAFMMLSIAPMVVGLFRSTVW